MIIFHLFYFPNQYGFKEIEYDNLPLNPTDRHISKAYKSNPRIIRDNILEKNYNQNITKKINAYNNFKLS